jgi:hypothetical protein
MLTAGGFYDRLGDYASFVREAVAARDRQTVAYDFSISYDYGVVLNAFAKCYANFRSGKDTSTANELLHLFNQYLGIYFELYLDRHEQQPNTLFSRELSYVMLGLATRVIGVGFASCAASCSNSRSRSRTWMAAVLPAF